MELGQNRDEIKQYLDARYVSAHEACWRFLECELHTQKPPLIPLPVHEKDTHSVVFDSNTDEMTILERVQRSKTMLMGYFEANSCYPEACSYLSMWNSLNTLSGTGHLHLGLLAKETSPLVAFTFIRREVLFAHSPYSCQRCYIF